MTTFNWFIFLLVSIYWFWFFLEICRNIICERENAFWYFVYLSPWSMKNTSKEKLKYYFIYLFLALHLTPALEMPQFPLLAEMLIVWNIS